MDHNTFRWTMVAIAAIVAIVPNLPWARLVRFGLRLRDYLLRKRRAAAIKRRAHVATVLRGGAARHTGGQPHVNLLRI